MSTLTFDGNEDSVAQSRLLVAALTEWLSEQPEQAPSGGGRAQFIYRADGTLDTVLTLPTEAGE